jgi:hypothetical protein
MARETTTLLIDQADNQDSWEWLARTCLEWMDESDVRSMAQHHDLVDQDDNDD